MDIYFDRILEDRGAKFVRFLMDKDRTFYYTELLTDDFAMDAYFEPRNFPDTLHARYDYLFQDGRQAFVFGWRHYGRHLNHWLLYVYICPRQELVNFTEHLRRQEV